MNTERDREWLCRSCNTTVDGHITKCPKCGAEHHEELQTEADEGEVVVIEESKPAEIKKAKYIFRESILVNAADILFILGAFCSVATLISPMFVGDNIQHITIISIVAGIVIFCLSIITWALLRSVAEISRMLRERSEKE